ncbi:NAD(P)-binding domain-containing protein [Roseovarius atlanticus]|nr:NAD(P)-binding domain-containing protein [Roseovarius atlanticus]MBY6123179.1 NAD(P)-binding domain-containing protein [Roseovarius atlanticus]MBY6147675.1 NAD(P)-binding domain-containing protein [Roseovarius atlanticus]
MQIGTIGAGQVAQAFARKAAAAGHRMILSNRRGPEDLAPLASAIGTAVSAAAREEAAACDIVLLAVPWSQVEDALSGLPDWRGRILIDATNAFDGEGRTVPDAASSSELVAALAPGARVVKALNATFMTNFETAPAVGPFRRAIFVSGDDGDAVEQVADLLEQFGFAPVDLGPLALGGRMQAVGSTLAGHEFFLPWPAPRSFPAFNGAPERTR